MRELVNKAAEYSTKAYSESTLNVATTQVLVIEENDATWIIFRGTEGKVEDIVADAKIRKKKIDIGKFHRGFYDAYMLVNDDIQTLAKEAKEKNRKLYIAGHSLGGALATVAALKLIINNIIPEQVITFGCPRVISKKTAKAINSKYKRLFCRVVNNNDVVTRVPPRSLNYSHIGVLWYFKESGNLVIDAHLSWWEQFWDRIDGRLKDFGKLGTDGLTDHFMESYKKQLGIA